LLDVLVELRHQLFRPDSSTSPVPGEEVTWIFFGDLIAVDQQPATIFARRSAKVAESVSSAEAWPTTCRVSSGSEMSVAALASAFSDAASSGACSSRS